MGHAIVEVLLLRRRREFPVQQEIAGLQEVALLGELLDRVAAVFQDAGVAVDIGDLGLAAAGGGEAGVIGEHPGLGVELADVDDVGAHRAAQDRKIKVLVADGEGRGLACGFCVHRLSPMRSLGLALVLFERWQGGWTLSSAVALTFASETFASKTFACTFTAKTLSEGQIRNRTGFLYLLVSFGCKIRKRGPPQRVTNAKAGTPVGAAQMRIVLPCALQDGVNETL